MKVLNLYACLGGNRLKWTDCEVTAVELDPELARMYQERFPNDTVIVADAHQFLLDHYKEFDFIWSSPPCPTHSRARFWGFGQKKPVYPDMKLYQEIIFLEHHFDGKWCVENVVPYYDPLIPQSAKIGRHLFWTNFVLPSSNEKQEFEKDDIQWLMDYHALKKYDYKGDQPKTKILRNLVHYETGNKIFNLARGIVEANNSEQFTLGL